MMSPLARYAIAIVVVLGLFVVSYSLLFSQHSSSEPQISPVKTPEEADKAVSGAEEGFENVSSVLEELDKLLE